MSFLTSCLLLSKCVLRVFFIIKMSKFLFQDKGGQCFVYFIESFKTSHVNAKANLKTHQMHIDWPDQPIEDMLNVVLVYYNKMYVIVIVTNLQLLKTQSVELIKGGMAWFDYEFLKIH